MNKQATRFIVGLAGAVVMIGGAGLSAQAQAGSGPSDMDKMFINKVGHGNSAEIQTSRLALKKSSDKKVRNIANMLIQQHGQAQQSLLKVGSQVSVPVPTMPDPAQKMQYKKLTSLSGAAFDKAYMQAQVGAHFATLNLFKKEMANGQDTQVRSFAQQYITDIQNHTQMIAAVASNLGIKVAEDSGTGKAASASMPMK